MRYDKFLNIAAAWAQLLAGLLLLAFGITLMVKANAGMFPWGVFQHGISVHFNIPFGFSIQVVGIFVIALAYLIGKIKPRFGTIANMILAGFFIDYVFYPIIPEYSILWQQIVMMLASTILCVIGTGIYMSADLGAGPRDSLMMALYIRIKASLRVVRTLLEIFVLIVGYFFGGKVGFGTIFYAVVFGPMLQIFLKLLKLFPINLVRVDILEQKSAKDM